MNITFDREKLLNAITCLKNITRMKSNLQVTHNLRFEVLTHSASLSANDLEVGAMTMVPCESEAAKIFLIHAGTLAGILENIKAQAITMEVPDIIAFGDSKAIIRVGKIEIGLPLADPDDFPVVTRLEADEAFTIDAPDFIGGVARTLYASSNDETRYVLTGLNMQLKAGTFYVVGTDGFRIAIFKKTVSEGGTSPSLVVPARVAKLIKEIIDEHATIEVTLEEKRAQFSTNTITIVSRIISERYPDYESLMESPEGAVQGVVFIRRVDLLAALKRMSVLAKKEDAAIMRRSPDGMRLDVETSSGYAKETIECRFRDTTPLAINISLKFLLDAIEHLTGEEVSIVYSETYGMIRIDEEGYTIGIMPIRLEVPALNEKETQQQGGAEAAREAHNLETGGSSPSPATKKHYKIDKGFSKKAIESVRNLCPSDGSSISEVKIHFDGPGVEHKEVILTKETRKKIDKTLNDMEKGADNA